MEKINSTRQAIADQGEPLPSSGNGGRQVVCVGGLGGSLCVELCVGDGDWSGSSLPGILLKGLEEACACEPPGSADQRNPKGL